MIKIYRKRGFDFEAFGTPYKLVIIDAKTQLMVFEDGTITASPQPIEIEKAERYVAEGHWDSEPLPDWYDNIARLKAEQKR